MDNAKDLVDTPLPQTGYCNGRVRQFAGPIASFSNATCQIAHFRHYTAQIELLNIVDGRGNETATTYANCHTHMNGFIGCEYVIFIVAVKFRIIAARKNEKS